MNSSLVFQFWVVGLMLTLTPGADWAYVIAAGLRARSVVPSILGIVFGYAVVVTIVAVGVGALVTEYPMVLTIATFAGAGYLIYLGVSTLRSKHEQVAVSDKPVGDNPIAQFFRGAGVSGFNPKGMLLLLALLPQFTSPAGWSASLQMLVLGGLHIFNTTVVYFLVALLARQILRSRPRASLIVTMITGILMTLIGLGILVEQMLAVL